MLNSERRSVMEEEEVEDMNTNIQPGGQGGTSLQMFNHTHIPRAAPRPAFLRPSSVPQNIRPQPRQPFNMTSGNAGQPISYNQQPGQTTMFMANPQLFAGQAQFMNSSQPQQVIIQQPNMQFPPRQSFVGQYTTITSQSGSQFTQTQTPQQPYYQPQSTMYYQTPRMPTQQPAQTISQPPSQHTRRERKVIQITDPNTSDTATLTQGNDIAAQFAAQVAATLTPIQQLAALAAQKEWDKQMESQAKVDDRKNVDVNGEEKAEASKPETDPKTQSPQQPYYQPKSSKRNMNTVQDRCPPRTNQLQIRLIHWGTETPLGEGGYGEVSKVKCDMSNGDEKFVAMKRVVDKRKGDLRIQEKLKDEARFLKALSHKNILKLYGWPSTEKGYFLALEYLENGSIDDFFFKYNKDTIDLWHTKFFAWCEIADGVKHLHDQYPRVIHRDLKPANVLLGKIYDTRAVVKIADFGLSEWKKLSETKTIVAAGPEKSAQEERRRWRKTATDACMPPEYWDNIMATPNEKYDVYSFGILGWEILMENYSFGEVHSIEHAVKRGLRPEPMPSHSSPEIKQMTKLIKKCWAQKKDKRPTFAVIVEELKPYRCAKGHTGMLIKELAELKQRVENENEQSNSDLSYDGSLLSGFEDDNSSQLQYGFPQGPSAQEPAEAPPPEQEIVNPNFNQEISQPPQERVTVPSDNITGSNVPQQIHHAPSPNAVYHPTRSLPPTQRQNETTERDVRDFRYTHDVAMANTRLEDLNVERPDDIPEANGAQEDATEEDYRENALSMDGFMPGQRMHVSQNLQKSRKNPSTKAPEPCSWDNLQQGRNRSPSPPPNGGANSQGLTSMSSQIANGSNAPVSQGKKNQDGGGNKDNTTGQRRTTIHGSGQPTQVINVYNVMDKGTKMKQIVNVPDMAHHSFPPEQLTGSSIIIQGDNIHIGSNVVQKYGQKSGLTQGKTIVPKSKPTLKITSSKKVVDQENIDRVAPHIGKKWKTLAREMRFTRGEIDVIDADNDQYGLQEKVFQLLLKWVQKEAKEASFEKLAILLIKVGKPEVAAMLKP